VRHRKLIRRGVVTTECSVESQPEPVLPYATRSLRGPLTGCLQERPTAWILWRAALPSSSQLSRLTKDSSACSGLEALAKLRYVLSGLLEQVRQYHVGTVRGKRARSSYLLCCDGTFDSNATFWSLGPDLVFLIIGHSSTNLQWIIGVKRCEIPVLD
jgi:hypothetical protein